MVPFKPFSVLIRPVAQTLLADGVFGNPSVPVEAIGLQAFFEPLGTGEAYERWGVVLRQPACILCDPADAGAFTPDAEVLVDGRVYRVLGTPEIYDGGFETDYAEVRLEAKQYPLS
jgi:hypothetical protein